MQDARANGKKKSISLGIAENRLIWRFFEDAPPSQGIKV